MADEDADPLDLESARQRIRELRRREANLEVLDGLLNTLAGVLDIRDVFERVSEIAHQVLPHDALSIAEAVDEGRSVRVHASHGLGRLPQPYDYPAPDPSMVSSPWEYRLIADVRDVPAFANHPGARAGMRCMMFVAIRFEGKLFGGLNFYSRTAGFYSPADVLVARRITDHVALALSHARLAEAARRNVELRAQATNIELLDQLLAALVDSGSVSDTFDRVSSIAVKVLPHDASALIVPGPDGRAMRVLAGSGLNPNEPAVPTELLARSQQEHQIVSDLVSSGEYAELANQGFAALLRVPVRIEQRPAGALIFLSRTAGAFSSTSVPPARRLADRLAATLAHDREIEAARRADEATARAARLEARVRALTDELDARTGYRRVVGESREWHQVLTEATQVAATDTTVLLLGESGTGKEVVARFLHRGSPRAKGPFIALNCAALPEQLLEAELFGYERGAYTGATQSKPGQLEQAAGGTLFLDEVAEMSPSAQAKFLRVLQEREFQRLGGTRVLRTDARVVAATNRDLLRGIANGQFREDLYYRLNVFAIRLPPLRDRRDDILPLSEAFLNEIGRGLGRPPGGISRDARAMLVEYRWPGNVRELRNVLERAAILADGGLITAELLALKLAVAPASTVAPVGGSSTASPSTAAIFNASPAAGPTDLASMERAMIEQALQNARFNKSKAAQALGLTRHQLYIKLRRYGME
jgi:transcriptional regulator with GAF, ATPase, and Fis domain